MLRPKYQIEVFWSEVDGGYIANVPDLKYCSAFGETREEALREIQDAIDLHLEVLQETGRPIPQPREYTDIGLPQQRIDSVAEQFAEAVRESYQMVADRAAKQLNAELTQNFFNSVINNLRSQAESSRQMTEELQGQQERQREATQALTEESVGVYMDFVNSMFAYWHGGVQTAERGARETEKAAKGKKS